MKKSLILILTALMLVSFSLPASAVSSVEITTVIPEEHKVTVVCGTGGKITVSGTDCTGTSEFTVPRGGSFALTATADKDYALNSITSNSINGMTLGTGTAALPNVCGDVRITVSFRSTIPAPDIAPVYNPPSAPTSDQSSSPISGQPSAPTSDQSSSPISDQQSAPISGQQSAPISGQPSSPISDRQSAPISGQPSSPISGRTVPISGQPSVPIPGQPSVPIPGQPSVPVSAPAPAHDPINTTVPVTGADESISAGATVTGDTAAIAVDKAKLAALLTSDTAASTVTIDVSGADANVNIVVLSRSTVQAVADHAASENNVMTGMDVVMPHATIAFNVAALNAITEQAQEDDMTFHVERIGAERLNLIQQTALQDTPDNVVVIEITLRSGGAIISDFHGGNAEIRLPYTPQTNEDTETITVWFVAQDGTIEKIPCRYEDNNVIFTVWHFSNYFVRPGTITADIIAAMSIDSTSAHPHKADESDHCFICGWFGRDIAPRCTLMLLLLTAALAGGGYLVFIRLRKRASGRLHHCPFHKILE